jgi:hypothetical protein
MYVCMYVCMYLCMYVCMLEHITTEPHVHEISADIVRVWLSRYILQQCTLQTTVCSRASTYKPRGIRHVCICVSMYIHAHRDGQTCVHTFFLDTRACIIPHIYVACFMFCHAKLESPRMTTLLMQDMCVDVFMFCMGYVEQGLILRKNNHTYIHT